MNRPIVAIAVVFAGFSCTAAQRYTGSGLAISIDRTSQTVVVSHESIAGYMDAMTMPFHVRDPRLLNGIQPGDRVDFTLAVDARSSWVEQLRVAPFLSTDKDPAEARQLALAESALRGSAHEKPETPRLVAGQAVPGFTLTDQNDRPVSLSQFSGKVIALNFAYTRCPLPDFCFRLLNNLAQIRKRFSDRLGKDLVLITITFDPVNDTPAAMARYAHIWNADSASWHFLTGKPAEVRRVCSLFGVEAWLNEGILTHSLHTAVIGRDGKLAANLEGNLFTPKQLGDLVDSVLKRPK